MNHFQIANTRKKSAIEELGKLVKSYIGGTSTKKRTYLKSGEHIDAVSGVELSDVKLLDGLPEEARSLIKRAENRKIIETIRQQNNIETVIDIAEVSLEGKECNTNDEVDEDFITRLFDIAKDANKKEMQFIWGKILAQEIISPGNFSLRTLETVKNLSKKDADVFQKIVPLILIGAGEKFIVSDNEILEKYGIGYDNILLLDDCGLINSAGLLAFTFEVEAGEDVFLSSKEYVIRIRNKADTKRSLRLGAFTLKNSGVELLQILLNSVNKTYLKDLVEYIRKKNHDLEVTVHNVVEVNEDESFKYTSVDISGNL